MKKMFRIIGLLVIVTGIFSGCASSVALEEYEQYKVSHQVALDHMQSQIDELEKSQHGFVLKSELAQQLEETFAFMGTLQVKLDAIESELAGFAKTSSVVDLKSNFGKLEGEFTSLYSALDEFVRLAGYENADDFLTLGRDIVRVNENIRNIDQKIENLRAAMALFVSPPNR
ncbi:MAG: hypothetical protein WCS59_01605 [Sphaerochaetaceae bacterium]|jgi:hypothetical protein|nr:hypothetical protein [Sphaerochaetaceae bacterium]